MKDVVILGGRCYWLNNFNFFLYIASNDTIFFPDLALSNKLVVYDLERQVIGWTDYDCEFLTFESSQFFQVNACVYGFLVM
jgi:hypothetical protein